MLFLGLVAVGCSPSSTSDRPAASPSEERPAAPVDHVAVARRKLSFRDFDSAAEAAYKALLQDPENADALLLAGEAEAARGNHQAAADLAGSIDIGSRLGKRAVDLRYRQLLELKQWSAAADAILAGQREIRDSSIEWRHEAWELLNRLGRREEASLQVDALCRAGQATIPQLHSLIRRTRSFPFELNESEDPEQYFEPGLGMARWYFTRKEYEKAFEQLEAEKGSERFNSAAACALYGRLLAETQALEEFPSWYAYCDDEVRELGDYWAALGVFFYDMNQLDAAARSLLESVYRNPTDRVSLQRLSKVFHSLERSEDGYGYRDRAINVADTERLSDAILESDDSANKMDLVKELAGLARPFETLSWTLSLAPPGGVEKRRIEQQLAQYQRDSTTWTMAQESSLLSIPRSNFQLGQAMALLSSAAERDEIAAVGTPVLAQPRLVNVAAQRGIDFRWYRDIEYEDAIVPIHESVGGGIAVLDYNLDGWPDVYLAQGSGQPPTDRCTRSNGLLKNSSAQYEDVTALAGAEDYNYGSGLAAGDVNQDGFPDLWVGSLGRNRLLINNGDGTFQDVTERMGQFRDCFTSSLAIADINGDSLPDLYESNYIVMEGGFDMPALDADGKPVMPGPLSHYSEVDRWWENLGDGSFTIREIPREVALPGTGLGVIVTDFDADGKNDVFVGNDIRANHLLIQSEQNQFVNIADAKGVANGYSGIPNGCMGISANDFNRDGLIDLHITNFNNESSNLYMQKPGGMFTDVAIRYGIEEASDPMVAFGVKAIDVDRNGWLDLIVTNGHIFDTRIFGEEMFQMPPQMLMNDGRRFSVSEVDDDSGYWQQSYLGRAMATLDYDQNGTVDVLIGHLHQPVALLENRTESGGDAIQIELVGTAGERDAIGTRVDVIAGGQRFTQWVTAGDGYFCSDESVLDFGLGVDQSAVAVEVTWPGGRKQRLDDLQTGSRYLIVEGEDLALTR